MLYLPLTFKFSEYINIVITNLTFISNITNITLPSLAQRFNCYLPACNISEKMDFINGVRPIYITYSSDCSVYQNNLILLLVVNVLLFIGVILLIKYESSIRQKIFVKKKMPSVFGNSVERE